MIEPRKLHSTSWGFLCPAETPEGQSVGVVKNISYMTCISGYSDSNCIHEYVDPFVTRFTEESDPEEFFDKVKVFINGRWVGTTDRPMDLYMDMKDKKYKGLVHIYTSIIFNTNDQIISICNDCGRLVRPLLKVRNNRILLDQSIIQRLKTKDLQWNDLCLSNKIETSVIEYVDAEEQSLSMVFHEKQDHSGRK